jgi:hypothetical protein
MFLLHLRAFPEIFHIQIMVRTNFLILFITILIIHILQLFKELLQQA